MTSSGSHAPLVGKGPSMQAVFDRMEKAAACDMPVLLHGAEGAGKRTVAREIQRKSRRAASPWISVRCRDAAHHRMVQLMSESGDGILEATGGGTLYLDEVTALPSDLQVVLLRLLEREDAPRVLAGTRMEPEEVQVILREDFFYRIHVIPIRIPPLSERKEDIPELARNFASRAGLTPEIFHGPDWTDDLVGMPWPGNLQELDAFIRKRFGRQENEIPVVLETDPRGRSLKSCLSEYEKAVILRTLKAVAGSRKEAARLLGVDRKTLYNRMRALGIS